MNDFDLSLCIPTYNRAASVVPLVQKILDADLARVEVVVLDNGSNDDTLSRLRAIAHPRLAIHSNGFNRGVIFNVLNVLDHGRGRFGALLLDKDDLDPAGLNAFRQFLVSEPNLACGYCPYASAGIHASKRFLRGREALDNIAYLGHHPTGYYFNLALLRSLDFTQRFSDFEFVGHFPFDFIFAELSLLGDAAVYGRPLFSPESHANAALTKSIGTNASAEDAFFSPRGRMKTAINFSRHIQTLPITQAHKNALLVERFVRGVGDATLGYRAIMQSAALCAHYHIAPRHVNVAEMLSIAKEFYRCFRREALLPAAGDSLHGGSGFHRDLAFTLFSRVKRRMTKDSA